MPILQLLPFVVVAGIAAFAIYNRCFNDNLLQRIGLSVVSFTAVIKVAATIRHVPSDLPTVALMYGLALYAIGTAIKVHKGDRNNANPE